MSENSTPPGWGADALSSFLEEAQRNRYATFHNKKAAWGLLIEIDACFRRAVEKMINPKDLITPFSLMRCHSAWISACSTATAGQVPEAFALLRAALEFSGYGLLMEGDPTMRDIWFERNDSEAAKKRMQREFTLGVIRKSIAEHDAKLAEVFQYLYDMSIDQGAHPNQLAVMGSTAITEIDDGRRLDQIYLHGDGVALDAVLKATVEVGICCLMILQHTTTFKARFDLLGIKHRLIALRRNVDALVKLPINA